MHKKKFAIPSQEFYNYPIPIFEKDLNTVPKSDGKDLNITSSVVVPTTSSSSVSSQDDYSNVPPHLIPLIPEARFTQVVY